MPKTPRSFCAAAIGDPHVGSAHGLICPGFGFELNNSQAWSWEQWRRFWADFHAFRGSDPFDLWINGDVVEGTKHRGEKLMDDLSMQCDAAATILESKCNDARRSGGEVFVTRGTDAHDNGHVAALFGRLVGAVQIGESTRAPHQWLLDYAGVRVILRHHPAKGGEYGGLKELEAEWLEHSKARGKAPPPTLLVTSHKHEGKYQYCAGLGGALRLSAWQSPTGFAQKVVAGKCLHASIGGAFVRFTEGEFPEVKEWRKPIPMPPTATRALSKPARSGKR
jgi:hypothetical protein